LTDCQKARRREIIAAIDNNVATKQDLKNSRVATRHFG